MEMRTHGIRTRAAIVERGLALATTGGFDAASIGAIAAALGMSKSGVFAHFGSKAQLDAALFAAAADRVTAAVSGRAALAPPGVARLIALAEGWLAPGVREALLVLTPSPLGLDPLAEARRREWRAAWTASLTDQLREAVRLGELAPACDVDQAAFEMNAVLMAALHAPDVDDTQSTGRARHAVEALMRRLSGPPSPSHTS